MSHNFQIILSRSILSKPRLLDSVYLSMSRCLFVTSTALPAHQIPASAPIHSVLIAWSSSLFSLPSSKCFVFSRAPVSGPTSLGRPNPMFSLPFLETLTTHLGITALDESVDILSCFITAFIFIFSALLITAKT